MRSIPVLFALATLAAPTLAAQRPDSLSQQVRQFVAADAPVIALTHVKVIESVMFPAAAPVPRTGAVIVRRFCAMPPGRPSPSSS